MLKGMRLQRRMLLAAVLALLADLTSAVRLRHTTLKKSTDYKVRLENYKNVQYSGEFLAGNQALPVIYDTGSFEVILLSKLCNEGCSPYLTMYDSAGSHSFSSSNIYGEHHFGSGSVYSRKGYETLAIGGQDSPLVTHHMQFWQVVRNDIAVWNERAAFSGIVGLSHTDIIPEGYQVDEFPEATLLGSMGVKRFAICLERTGPSAPGWLAAGPSMDALHQGVFQTVPMLGKVHWAVRMTDVHVQGLEYLGLCKDSCGAIIDSGTSLIAAPDSASYLIREIKSMVKTDCSNLAELPVLKLKLGDVQVELPPKAYVMKVRTQSNSSWYGTGSVCTAAFMTIDKRSQLGPVWILGMPFLRYYHTIFDRSAKQVHIAPSTPDCQAPTSFVAANGTANGSIHLVNVSSAAHLGLGTSTRAFESADYEAMPVEINATRVPSWALGKVGELLHI